MIEMEAEEGLVKKQAEKKQSRQRGEMRTKNTYTK